MQSITFLGYPLLETDAAYFPAIADSGTACMVLPDAVGGSYNLRRSPLKVFAALVLAFGTTRILAERPPLKMCVAVGVSRCPSRC